MKILSLDIGGTSIKSGIITIHDTNSFVKAGINPIDMMTITEKQCTLFNSENPRLSIIEGINKYCNGFDLVAVSATGVINENGIVSGVNGKIDNYLGLDIKVLVETLTNKQCYVLNDVAAIGITESKYSKVDSNMLVIALGTGIGGSLIINNMVINGSNGAFAEIGQIKIGDNTYEEIASTKALVRIANEEFGLDIENGKQFFELLETMDNDTLECFDNWCSNISKGLEYCLYFYNPKEIVLAGGVSEQSNKIIPKLYDNLCELPDVYIEDLKIRSAKQKNDAGIIGAALYAGGEYVKER